MAEERKSARQKMQNIMVENRKHMTVTGVLDVPKFTENAVLLKTELGKLIIRGNNFRITKLDVENGLADIEGNINSFEYAGKALGKVFGHGG